MKDIMSSVFTAEIVAWIVTSNLLLFGAKGRVVRAVFRVVCPLFVPALTVVAILGSHGLMVLFWAPVWLIDMWSWRQVHRRVCKDDHGRRRLLETARGLVQRRGNRLAVVAEVAR